MNFGYVLYPKPFLKQGVDRVVLLDWQILLTSLKLPLISAANIRHKKDQQYSKS